VSQWLVIEPDRGNHRHHRHHHHRHRQLSDGRPARYKRKCRRAPSPTCSFTIPSATNWHITMATDNCRSANKQRDRDRQMARAGKHKHTLADAWRESTGRTVAKQQHERATVSRFPLLPSPPSDVAADDEFQPDRATSVHSSCIHSRPFGRP
jgi:hypothetical protein